MSSHLKLSPTHGVNPSLDHCFWCGEPTGVALLGRLPNDAPAPSHICSSYEPCPDCQSKMDLGITIIEHDGIKPTGNWCVVTERVVDDLVGHLPDQHAEIMKIRRCFMQPDQFAALGLQTRTH